MGVYKIGLVRYLNWILILSLLLTLYPIARPALAKETLLQTYPTPAVYALPPKKGPTSQLNTVGDPIPRIQCPVGYVATIYAEGLSSPDGLAFNPAGILHVAEETAGRISRIEGDGSVTPVISGLSSPEGITFDNTGNLYVVEDVAGGRLLKIAPGGTMTVLASGLDAPEGVVWTSAGTIYITESNVQFTANPFNYATRVTTIPTLGGAIPLHTDALFWSYAGIIAGQDGLLYVTNEASGTGTHDSIFTVNTGSGVRTTFASNLVSPEGLRFADNGGFPLYVAEENTGSGDGKLSRVESNGTHLPFCTDFYNIEDVVIDETGRVFVSEDTTGSIIVITEAAPAQVPAQAIILLIGDGMGEAHRTAARWSAVGQSGALAMDKLPFVGWASTASANDAVTDSAAAATALATGVKTNNLMIGQDPAGKPLLTLLEQAQAKGMAVGLVTTTQMAHATPAAFAAHVPNRNMMTEIARQMIAAEVDVLLGGGEDEFLPDTTSGCYPESGERTDGRNLIDEAIAAGYTYVCNAADLATVDPATTVRLLGLFADEGMSRPFSPSLTEMTQTAIDILSQNPAGFFLMVEGGQIDWASHNNLASEVISDTIDFDEAVEVAQAYASTVTNTLIIVTADHETGGMTASLTSSGLSSEDGPFYMPNGTTPFYINWATGLHTGVEVPTTAQGPWSSLLAGNFENTHIHQVMALALGRQRVWLPVILRK